MSKGKSKSSGNDNKWSLCPSKVIIEEIVNGNLEQEEVKTILTDNKLLYLDSPVDDMKNFLIFKAARAENLDLVKLILEIDPFQINLRKRSNGADVFQNAVIAGNLDMVKFLIEKGADPTYRYRLETSILFFAAKYKHLHIFKYLVEELRMDPHDILCTNGLQALYISIEQRDKELFSYILSFNPFIENIGCHNYLALASCLDETYYLEALLDHGAPFQKMENIDRSPFSWACEENRFPQAEILLKRCKGIKPELLLDRRVHRIAHEYNNLCEKWWRLYDIYMVRYFIELKRREIVAKGNPKKFIEDERMNSISKTILESERIENVIFKVSRNIFHGIMKYTETPRLNYSSLQLSSFLHQYLFVLNYQYLRN